MVGCAIAAAAKEALNREYYVDIALKLLHKFTDPQAHLNLMHACMRVLYFCLCTLSSAPFTQAKGLEVESSGWLCLTARLSVCGGTR